jgi:hypothetical protein
MQMATAYSPCVPEKRRRSGSVGIGLLAGIFTYSALAICGPYFRSPASSCTSRMPEDFHHFASPSDRNATLEHLFVNNLLHKIDVAGVGDVDQVLQRAADATGMSNDFAVRRQSLASSGLGDSDLALEVSPFLSPLLKQGPSTYNIDVRTKEELIKYYQIPVTQTDTIPPIHFKWSKGPYADIIDHSLKFKRVVASHVIEHVPDLIAWLNSLYDILAPQGDVRLFIPDMRFTFDCLRPPTTIHEIIGAYFQRNDRPVYGTILEHMYYSSAAVHQQIVSHENWQRPPLETNVLEDPYHLEILRSIVDFGKREFTGASYIDAHVWKWTPQLFATQMDILRRIGLLKLRLDVVIPTSPTGKPGLHATEFFAVFVRDA